MVDETRKSKINLIYMNEVMTKMNFSVLWRRSIMECVSSTSASVIFVCIPTAKVSFGKGLRKGDHISLVMFFIVVEEMNITLNVLVKGNLYTSYKGGRFFNWCN